MRVGFQESASTLRAVAVRGLGSTLLPQTVSDWHWHYTTSRAQRPRLSLATFRVGSARGKLQAGRRAALHRRTCRGTWRSRPALERSYDQPEVWEHAAFSFRSSADENHGGDGQGLNLGGHVQPEIALSLWLRPPPRCWRCDLGPAAFAAILRRTPMAMVAAAAAPYRTLADDDLVLRPATLADLPTLAAMEQAGYPEDEAASSDTLRYRINHAPEYFLVGKLGGIVAGFVCGTLAAGDRLDHEFMGRHDPAGGTLCIHSVCVAPAFQRRGIGQRVVKGYIAAVRACHLQVHTIRLICKEVLVPFYERAGFTVVGPSAVVHGKDSWIECFLSCRTTLPGAPPTSIGHGEP